MYKNQDLNLGLCDPQAFTCFPLLFMQVSARLHSDFYSLTFPDATPLTWPQSCPLVQLGSGALVPLPSLQLGTDFLQSASKNS